jgi:hypothetical protein
MKYLFSHKQIDSDIYHIFWKDNIVYTYAPKNKSMFADNDYSNRYSTPYKVEYQELELPDELVIYDNIINNNVFTNYVNLHKEKIILDSI